MCRYNIFFSYFGLQNKRGGKTPFIHFISLGTNPIKSFIGFVFFFMSDIAPYLSALPSLGI